MKKTIFQIVAVFKAIYLSLSMLTFILLYLVSRIFFKKTVKSTFDLRKRWLKYQAIPVMGIDVKTEGQPIKEPALYVCNHRSFTDPVILCRFLDAYVIAKAEVSRYPLINKGAELTGVLYVDRENRDSRQAARDKMVETIQRGYNVLVYPEGTVGVKKGTLDFKKGTFLEAAKEGIPVIPVTLEYRDQLDFWQNRSFPSQYMRQFSKWKTEAKLKFGPTLRSNDGEELCTKAYDWINASLAEMQKDWTRVDFDGFKRS